MILINHVYGEGSDRSLYLVLYNQLTGKLERFRAYNHNPYLVTKQEFIEVTEKAKSMIHSIVAVTKHNSIARQDEEFAKVETFHPSNIYNEETNTGLKVMLPKSWENAIPYHQCYVYDKCLIFGCDHKIEEKELVLSIGSVPLPDTIKSDNPLINFYFNVFNTKFPSFLRVGLDIEIEVTDGAMPNVILADKRIVAVGVAWNMNGGSIKKFSAVLGEKDGQIAEGVYSFTDEKAMLEKCLHVLEGYAFIVTHNGDELDLPYLKNRSEKLGIKTKIVKRAARKYSEYYTIGDAIHIDTFRLFSNGTLRKEVFKNKYKTCGLEDLSQTFLGRGKINAAYNIDLMTSEELGRYCANDASLALELTTFDNDYVMNILTMLSRISNISYNETFRTTISTWARSYSHFCHRKLNILIPNDEDMRELNKKYSTNIPSRYRGAITLDPEALGTVGIHFNTWVLDFSSLYPTCVVLYNISYDSVNCGHDECKTNAVPEHEGLYFCKKKKGTFPLLVENIRELRIHHYKPLLRESKTSWLTAVVDILRIFLNAWYGVTGDEDITDLFARYVASATTAWGRHTLLQLIEHADNKAYYKLIDEDDFIAFDNGLVVLYGDTDSIFVLGDESRIKELIEFSHNVLGVELDLKGRFRSFCLSRKKNYLLVHTDGRVEPKGLVGKKSHVCKYIKKVFNDVSLLIAKVEKPDDVEVAKTSINETVKKARETLVCRKVELDELTYQIELGKDPLLGKGQDYNVARQMIASGIAVRIGDTIRKVFTTGENTAEPAGIVEPRKVNVKTYINHMAGVLAQLLEPLGMNVEDVLADSLPTKMEDFIFNENVEWS